MIPQQLEEVIMSVRTRLPQTSISVSSGVALTVVVLGVPTFQALKHFVKFIFGYIHYRNQAIETGLPRVSVPYLETNTFFANVVRSDSYKKIVYGVLPSSWISWARWVRPEWRWIGKYSIHVEKGDLFQVVTPEQVVVNTSDADIIMDILNRKNDFPKYQPVLAPVRLFGENSLTMEGHGWTRHRKIVGPPFSEGANQLVWNEAIRQATSMLGYWKRVPSAEHAHLLVSLKLLALNVLSYTEFGIPLPFDHRMDLTALTGIHEEKLGDEAVAESLTHPPPGHKMTFRTAFSLITNDFRKVIATIMVPKWMHRILGADYTTLHTAKNEVDAYIQEMIKREQVSPSLNETGKETLMSALVRSEAAERGADEAAGLSMSEMLGNTYLFALAGLDTTSSSLQFTLINLAIHQDKQAWLHKQLDEDLLTAGMGEDPSNWNYNELFPKLTGPMCVIYESLRTHPTTPTLLRWTGDKSQTVTMDGKSYVLAPGYVIAMNFIGVHYNPKYWGADADQFKPERWAMNSPVNKHNPDIQASGRFPGLRKPARGTFLPWSEGFRACLGRRFAEVEMAAVLATLFSQHRCEVRRYDGESMADAKKRAQIALDTATMQLSLGVRNKVELVWYPRK